MKILESQNFFTNDSTLPRDVPPCSREARRAAYFSLICLGEFSHCAQCRRALVDGGRFQFRLGPSRTRGVSSNADLHHGGAHGSDLQAVSRPRLHSYRQEPRPARSTFCIQHVFRLQAAKLMLCHRTWTAETTHSLPYLQFSVVAMDSHQIGSDVRPQVPVCHGDDSGNARSCHQAQ